MNDLALAKGGVKVVDLFETGQQQPSECAAQPLGMGHNRSVIWHMTSRGDAAIVQLCWGEVSDRLPADWTLIRVLGGARNVVFLVTRSSPCSLSNHRRTPEPQCVRLISAH